MTFQSFDERAQRTERMLGEAARALGAVVSGDGRIAELDAARLLGLSVSRLKQLRAEGAGPAAYRLGLNGCRLSYRLADLAAWLEARRDGL
jgi:hypothetical protein